jgi:hypothetical protein
MLRISVLFAFLAICCGFARAETWSGNLVDAKCAEEQKSAACTPTASTTAFALNISGKMYRLDETGNTKAAEAVKSSADRAKDPNAPSTNAAIKAQVTGTLEGETIKVESIAVQ